MRGAGFPSGSCSEAKILQTQAKLVVVSTTAESIQGQFLIKLVLFSQGCFALAQRRLQSAHVGGGGCVRPLRRLLSPPPTLPLSTRPTNSRGYNTLLASPFTLWRWPTSSGAIPCEPMMNPRNTPGLGSRVVRVCGRRRCALLYSSVAFPPLFSQRSKESTLHIIHA